jgi:TDG/mug DNA glycosylase family protein
VPTVSSFPPIASAAARVLILGSMPGVRSLAARQYYAHPQNAFWPILGAICGFRADAPYAERKRHLIARGIAVWDVLRCCERKGSLDTSIVRASMQPNDFEAFFARHPRVELVLCNGGTAFRLYTTRVVPALPPELGQLRALRLPSTSPAHAGLRLPQKLALWRAALAAGRRPS